IPTTTGCELRRSRRIRSTCNRSATSRGGRGSCFMQVCLLCFSSRCTIIAHSVALAAISRHNGAMTPSEQQPLGLADAAERWVAHQRRRRRPLSARTIDSYCDAWRSFSAWAQQQDKKLVAEIGVHDLRDWLDELGGYADNSVQTYCHGALAICRWLA